MSVEKINIGYVVRGENLSAIDGNTGRFGNMVYSFTDFNAPIEQEVIHIIRPFSNEAKEYYDKKVQETNARTDAVNMMNA